MSIKPIDMTGPMWIVYHDDQGYEHEGEIDPNTIGYAARVDGSPDFNFLNLICPVEGCDSVSLWPVSGGAAPKSAQEMFVRLAVLKGSPVDLAIEDVKARCIAIPGSHHWEIDEDQLRRELGD